MIKYEEIKTETIEDVLGDVTVTKDNCYLYPYVMGNGYPQYQKNGTHVLVHRLMKAFSSQIDLDKSLVVHHTCGNPNCVNPAHLEVMTPEEHLKLHNTRLNDVELFVIFKKYYNDNLTLMELSEELKSVGIDVHYSYISKLVNGKVRVEEVKMFDDYFNSRD